MDAIDDMNHTMDVFLELLCRHATHTHTNSHHLLLSMIFFYSYQTGVNEAPVECEKDKLQEKWESSKCKTKLIAL